MIISRMLEVLDREDKVNHLEWIKVSIAKLLQSLFYGLGWNTLLIGIIISLFSGSFLPFLTGKILHRNFTLQPAERADLLILKIPN